MPRKPKPVALKLLAGNPGRHRLPNVPQPATELPDCPEHLSGEAVVEWERISPQLVKLGLLSQLDRAALAMYCSAWGRWIDAERKLEEGGTVVKSPSGYPIQNPYLAVASGAAKQMFRMLAEFGLSPSARCSLDLVPNQPQSTLALFARRRDGG